MVFNRRKQRRNDSALYTGNIMIREVTMAFLEENEWMFLNEISYNISFIYSFDEMRLQTLNWLKLLIGFDGAVFSTVEDGEVKQSVSVGFDDSVIKKYEALYHDSPMYWILLSGRNYAYLQSELVSSSSAITGDFYESVYKSGGFEYSMGINIVFREEVIGIINFYRTHESGDFTKREMFVLNQLQKHLAYRLYYEAKKGDTRYFFAKGYHDKISKDFGLTVRESELLEYAVKGYSNEKIAETMSISISTVKKHFHSLYEKMNVKNRVQLLQCLPLSTDKINFDEL